MKMTWTFRMLWVAAGGLMAFPLVAQESDIPLLLPKEQEVVDQQTAELFEQLTPLAKKQAPSVVTLGRPAPMQAAYGVVIGNGNQVLTKWSEVQKVRGALRMTDSTGAMRNAKVAGVYEEEDLAILSFEGAALPAVQWSTAKEPELGSFLVAPRPDGKALGFGVVSVLERSLRESNKAYLGLMGDFEYQGVGAKVRSIEPNTGVEAAGLKVGDVILKIGDRPISGLLELRNALNGKKPGDKVRVIYSRGGKEESVEVLLGGRPALPQMMNPRLRQMEQMGGRFSTVRDGFARVIQTDMQVSPQQCGGPVLDLKGEVIGLLVARADRTRSFILPSSRIVEILAQPATDPANAKVRRGDLAQVEPPVARAEGEIPLPQVPPGPAPRMLKRDEVNQIKRQTRDLDRLLQRLADEMEGLGEE